MFKRDQLPEWEIHRVLSSYRRRQALVHLWRRPGTVTLRELSEVIATAETDESPAPRDVRESVYNSLHQTHLPKLDELNLVRYDSDRKEIRALPESRTVGRYMDVVTKVGVSWGELYRTLGIIGLFMVVGSAADFPPFSLAAPLAWGTVFLVAFAVAAAYQLWTSHWSFPYLQRRG